MTDREKECPYCNGTGMKEQEPPISDGKITSIVVIFIMLIMFLGFNVLYEVGFQQGMVKRIRVTNYYPDVSWYEWFRRAGHEGKIITDVYIKNGYLNIELEDGYVTTRYLEVEKAK